MLVDVFGRYWRSGCDYAFLYGCVVVVVEEQVGELVGSVSECNEMRDLIGD